MAWKKLRSEPIRTGWRAIDRVVFKVPTGETVEFEIKQEGDAAVILALTPENEVVMAKQFRPGPEKVLVEMPGGGIDKDEEPLVAAKRELLEETGYEGDFEFVGTSYAEAYSTSVKYHFVARNCRKVAEPHDSPDEHTEAILLSLSDFRAHIRSGALTDTAAAYRSLDFIHLL